MKSLLPSSFARPLSPKMASKPYWCATAISSNLSGSPAMTRGTSGDYHAKVSGYPNYAGYWQWRKTDSKGRKKNISIFFRIVRTRSLIDLFLAKIL